MYEIGHSVRQPCRVLCCFIVELPFYKINLSFQEHCVNLKTTAITTLARMVELAQSVEPGKPSVTVSRNGRARHVHC